MQFGYLAHLAIQLLNSGTTSKSAPRDQSIASILVLKAMAEIQAAANVLATFYPGVCTALVKLLLQAGKEFKVAFKIVVVSCGCLGAWMRAVLGNDVNADLLGEVKIRPPLTLEELFLQHNNPQKGPDMTVASGTKQAAGQSPGSRGVLPALHRDSAWLRETGRQSSDALVAVLRQAETAAETLWAEKASVRQAFLDLCISVLRHCDRSVTGEAVEACFEVVLAGLSDESPDAKRAATTFMCDLLADKYMGEQSANMRGRILEWLVKLTKDLQATSSKVEGARHVPKPLARLEGLLAFIESLPRSHSEQLSWQTIPPTSVGQLLEPVLQSSQLEASGLQNLLSDERSLTSVPGSSVSHAESLVKLFPYELEDTYQSGEEAGADIAASCRHPEESNQVQSWLLRSLKLTGGDISLARHLQRVLGRLGSAAGFEAMMTAIFEDEQCAWQQQISVEEPFPLSPPDPSESVRLGGVSLQRRSAAMFALAAFLEQGGTDAEMHFPALPPWLALQCLSLGLAGRGGRFPNLILKHVLRSFCS